MTVRSSAGPGIFDRFEVSELSTIVEIDLAIRDHESSYRPCDDVLDVLGDLLPAEDLGADVDRDASAADNGKEESEY